MPLTRAQASHACIRATGGQFEYSLRHKLVRTFKLSLYSLLNKTFLSHYRQFPGIYFSQGSVAMRLRSGGINNEYSLLRLPLSPLVKEFLKSVNIWHSIVLFFFLTHRAADTI